MLRKHMCSLLWRLAQPLLAMEPSHPGNGQASVCCRHAVDLQQFKGAMPFRKCRSPGMLARRYVRKLRLADGAPPTLLAIAPGPGMLVAHSWADLGLHVFSLNGARLVSCAGSERLSALALSPTGHFLLTGGLRGVVSLLWLHSLEVSLLLQPPFSALSLAQQAAVPSQASASACRWTIARLFCRQPINGEDVGVHK